MLEQRSEAEIEETMAARVNVLQTVSQVMAKELGREATVEELAEKMKMTPDEIKDIMKLALDALTVNGEGTAASDGRQRKIQNRLLLSAETDMEEAAVHPWAMIL